MTYMVIINSIKNKQNHLLKQLIYLVNYKLFYQLCLHADTQVKTLCLYFLLS